MPTPKRYWLFDHCCAKITWHPTLLSKSCMGFFRDIASSSYASQCCWLPCMLGPYWALLALLPKALLSSSLSTSICCIFTLDSDLISWFCIPILTLLASLCLAPLSFRSSVMLPVVVVLFWVPVNGLHFTSLDVGLWLDAPLLRWSCSYSRACACTWPLWLPLFLLVALLWGCFAYLKHHLPKVFGAHG